MDRAKLVTLPSGREIIRWRDQSILIERVRHARVLRATVQPNGVIVMRGPSSMRVSHFEEFLGKNGDWVQKQFLKILKFQKENPPKTFTRGDEFLFRGRRLKLVYVKGEDRSPYIYEANEFLVVEVPPKMWNESYVWAPQPHAAQWVRDFYSKRGRELLEPQCWAWSDSMKLRPTSVEFRGQTTLWGSCTRAGLISLNWKLVAAPTPISDYVLIHELCHLRHMNHSRSFWELVAHHCPDFKLCKLWLRENHFAFDFLNRQSTLFVSKL